MFKFEKEQSVWDFNGTKIGGQPGEYPTVLGASIFYNKHECVLDDKTGKIDKAKAEALWNRCQVLSDLTGIPHFIQIIGLVSPKGTCPCMQVCNRCRACTPCDLQLDQRFDHAREHRST
jgi:tetrahydromethanopterin S-methyltransferase subunit H